MAKVLKSDSTADDAYVQKNVSGHSEIYITALVGIDSAALTAFTSDGFSGEFAAMIAGGAVGLLATVGLNDPGGGLEWWESAAPGGGSASPAPSADVYHVVEVHYKTSDGTQEVWIDSTNVYTGTWIGAAVDPEVIIIGQFGGAYQPNEIAYIGYVKIGTSRGGSEIYVDDFSAGLGGWDLTYGAVSIIDDPIGGDVDDLGGGGGGPPPGVVVNPEEPKEGDWRFDLCTGGASNSSGGTKIVTLDPWATDRKFDFDLNRPRQCSFKVPSNLDAARNIYTDGFPNLSCGDRTLKCYRYENHVWKLRYTGIIWSIEDDGDEDACYTQVVALDAFQFLFKRLVRNAAGVMKKTVKIANNGGAAIKNQIVRTVTYIGPCYLDDMDNSHIDTTSYLTFSYDQEYIARAIQEICDTGTVDVDFVPLDRTDGIIARLDIYGRMGSDKSDTVGFSYASVPCTAKEWKRGLDFQTTANTIHNFSGNKKKRSDQHDTASQDRFGICEEARVLTDIVHQSLLDALTAQELNERKSTRENIAVIPQPEGEGEAEIFVDFFLGDSIFIECSDEARQAVNGIQRLYGFTLDIDDEGVERLAELRVSPSGS